MFGDGGDMVVVASREQRRWRRYGGGRVVVTMEVMVDALGEVVVQVGMADGWKIMKDDEWKK